MPKPVPSSTIFCCPFILINEYRKRQKSSVPNRTPAKSVRRKSRERSSLTSFIIGYYYKANNIRKPSFGWPSRIYSDLRERQPQLDGYDRCFSEERRCKQLGQPSIKHL